MTDSDTSLWFTYLLNPARLMTGQQLAISQFLKYIATDLSAGPTVAELQPLLKDLLTNLLNNQHAGFFTDNPQVHCAAQCSGNWVLCTVYCT